MKAKCTECGEYVRALRLHLGKSIRSEAGSTPVFLTSSHPTKDGCRVTKVVSEKNGEVVQTYCYGSLRPVAEVFSEQ